MRHSDFHKFPINYIPRCVIFNQKYSITAYHESVLTNRLHLENLLDARGRRTLNLILIYGTLLLLNHLVKFIAALRHFKSTNSTQSLALFVPSVRLFYVPSIPPRRC